MAFSHYQTVVPEGGCLRHLFETDWYTLYVWVDEFEWVQRVQLQNSAGDVMEATAQKIGCYCTTDSHWKEMQGVGDLFYGTFQRRQPCSLPEKFVFDPCQSYGRSLALIFQILENKSWLTVKLSEE